MDYGPGFGSPGGPGPGLAQLSKRDGGAAHEAKSLPGQDLRIRRVL